MIKFFKLYPDYSNRIFGLDILRSLAIVFVVMGHGIMLEKANTDFPWVKLIDGVELFFVLSGFLIGGILLKAVQKEKQFTIASLKHFWIRRWFRTLPMYYIILLVNFLFAYYAINNGDLSAINWKYFLFLQNFMQPISGLFIESWSLCIEEWFYILFPLILYLVFKIGSYIQLQVKTLFFISVFIFLLVPFIFRITIASHFQVDEYWLNFKIHKVVLFRLDSIAWGLFAVGIKFWYQDFWIRFKNLFFILGIAICYGVLYTAYVPNELYAKVFKVTLMGIGCMFLLPKFEGIKSGPTFIVKIVTHISLISYSMYLINLSIIAEVIYLFTQPANAVDAWFLYLLFWFLVIAIATLLYKYIEKPMMDLREKF